MIITEKFIFIAVPRTGSISFHTMVEEALKKKIDHGRAIEYHTPIQCVNESVKEKKFKFGFIRNPYSRFVSLYKSFAIDRYEVSSNRTIFQSFENFTKRFLFDTKWRNDIHFKSCSYFLCENNNISVDFIGRYENYLSDVDHIKKIIDLPEATLRHINICENDKDWSYRKFFNKYKNLDYWKSFYTSQKLKDIVYSIYREDFDRFEYSRDF